MKKHLPFFFLTTVLGMPAALAAGRPVDGVKVNYNLVGTPEIVAQIKGGTPKRPRIIGPGEPAPVWLEVETEFDAADEFPELTFKYSVLLKSGQTLKLIEGEVVHVDVAKGRERHSVMYIGPKSLNRLSENKAFSPTNIWGVFVEISAQGQLIGLAQKSSHGTTYEAFAKERDKLEKVSDAFLTKGQTPFAPLFWDYYEAVKPSTR